MKTASTVDLIIIGAGAAGLSAARTARTQGLSVAVIEASHRIGGRAFTDTETLGVPFDLGCHWMHSGSINPFVAIAESYGFAYTKEGFEYPADVGKDYFLGDHWADEAEQAEIRDFAVRYFEAIEDAAERGEDVSVADVTERDSRWTAPSDYMMSLWTSHGPDEISVIDIEAEDDTDENWPVTNGYGALVARYGKDVPVELNTKAERIDWGGKGVAVTTPKGTINGRAAIVTVSSSVLAADDMLFEPRLPDWKLEAIHGLPLGLANRVALLLDAPVGTGADIEEGFAVIAEDETPVMFTREGEYLLVCRYGGRHAWWIEKAGPDAMVDFAMAGLKRAFGSDLERRLVNSTVTAWGGDPLIRGAYSIAKPGCAHLRADYARPIDDRLFFAGEAASPDYFATCHGAYLSGIATAEAVAATLTPVAAQ